MPFGPSWVTWGCAPSKLPSQSLGWNRKEVCSSYWELVYSVTSKSFGWMPLFERAPWGKQPPGLVQRWQSNHSSGWGGFRVLCSIKKQAAWIGLSWQLGWVGVWSGRKGMEEEKRKRESVCLSVCQLTQSSQILNVSLLDASVFKCLSYKFSTVIDLA